MITVEQYAGQWLGRDDFDAQKKSNAQEKLLPAVNKLIAIAIEDGVEFKTNHVTKSQISGQALGGFRPLSCQIGAPKSNHKQGLAVDIYDPDGEIDKWCIKNLNKLEECGIWLEHPSATKGWSHWQCVPVKSGNRVFMP